MNDALKIPQSAMDQHYDKDCHLIARLYDRARYVDAIKYKGFRDYYMQITGYT